MWLHLWISTFWVFLVQLPENKLSKLKQNKPVMVCGENWLSRRLRALFLLYCEIMTSNTIVTCSLGPFLSPLTAFRRTASSFFVLVFISTTMSSLVVFSLVLRTEKSFGKCGNWQTLRWLSIITNDIFLLNRSSRHICNFCSRSSNQKETKDVWHHGSCCPHSQNIVNDSLCDVTQAEGWGLDLKFDFRFV